VFLKIVFTALNDTNTHFGKVFFSSSLLIFFFFSFFNSRMSFFLSWNFLFDEKFPKKNGKRKHKYLAEVRNNFWKKERDIRKIKIIKWWWDLFFLNFWMRFCLLTEILWFMTWRILGGMKIHLKKFRTKKYNFLYIQYGDNFFYQKLINYLIVMTFFNHKLTHDTGPSMVDEVTS